MATIAEPPASPRKVRKSIRPDWLEKSLAASSLLVMAAVLVALWRGRGEWSAVPAIVWLHLATIMIALALTPVLMLQKRGTARHRALGWIWASAMFATAFASLFVRGINPGGWSPIHVLSVLTLVVVPLAVWHARRHRVDAHRASMRGIVIGALLVAGVFTFPFERMLGRWLFG